MAAGANAYGPHMRIAAVRSAAGSGRRKPVAVKSWRDSMPEPDGREGWRLERARVEAGELRRLGRWVDDEPDEPSLVLPRIEALGRIDGLGAVIGQPGIDQVLRAGQVRPYDRLMVVSNPLLTLLRTD